MYIMNYNFMADKSVIDPSPTTISIVSGVQLSNAIFDHYTLNNIIPDVIDTTPPEEWDSTTEMDTNFNGNVNAGNIDYSTEDLLGVRIKRRPKGSFTWITIYDIQIEDVSELNFTKYDVTNQNGVIYEYAIVPYLNDYTECAYIIKEVNSYFDGIFVCSPDTIAKFYGGVAYGDGKIINKTGVFEPLGSKFPVVVSNADTKYFTGSVNATEMSMWLLMQNNFDRVANTNFAKLINDFLTDKTTKIIKDWNGNIWLAVIKDDVKIGYDNSVGMGVSNVSFDFVEVGGTESQSDLESSGFVNMKFLPENNPIPSHSPVPGMPEHSPENNPPTYLNPLLLSY